MFSVLVRFISLLALAVPHRDRVRWREEWLGELEEVARDRGLPAALRVAAGAVPDVRALRRMRSHASRQRDRRVPSLGVSWMDVKLGLRMLVKYPGLTLVAGTGMAVAIAVGASSFALIYASLHPTLPLPDGDRIVGVENWDTEINNQEERSLHDFALWRKEVTSIQDLSAFHNLMRNVTVEGRRAEQLRGAEMTASGFRVARVAPLLGRPLLDADDRKGALPVIVIGYEVWRTQFGSDPSVVGRTVRVGATPHTIVGVMPERFAFPISQEFWVPFRMDPADYERREGPGIMMFGRLAPATTLEHANAELALLGRRMAAAFPKTHARLRPRAVPYTELWFDDGPKRQLHFVQLLVSMLVVVVGVNVAILIYARTATRHGEILVRSALGASRRRIIGQLFVEALVLSSISAAAGLGLAAAALRQADHSAREIGARFMGGLPFWMTFEVSPGTVAYVMSLAVLAAIIAGVVPALKATGRRMQSSLSQLSGSTGMRLGSTWTALIVLQVAFAVAALPGAMYTSWQAINLGTADPGFAADRFLTARLTMDSELPPSALAEQYERERSTRYVARIEELLARLSSEPGVSAVTVALQAPGAEPPVRVDVEGMAPSDAARPGHGVSSGRVAINFFETFEIPILVGRPFRSGDLEPAANTVLVNRTFAEQIALEGSVIGRRLRYVGGYRSGGVVRNPRGVERDQWYEIVGVVGDAPAKPISDDDPSARVYHALAPAQWPGATLAIRMQAADPATFALRLRQMASDVDPTLRLIQSMPLSDVYRQEQMGLKWTAIGLAIVTGSVLLLSAAGIYALMSFTVTKRRKEIGIRVALGADRGRILRSIFKRAATQLAIGIAAGVTAAALLDGLMDGELMDGHWLVVLPLVSVFMMGVGLLAAFGPARRGLRVQPTEALREE